MFPQTVLGTKVELYYDGAWHPITPRGDVRGLGAADGEISIGMRGQPDESSGLEVAEAELSINNRDGKYSPRNPSSELYGKIGLNTPLRIVTDVSSTEDVSDTFDTDGVNGWPVSDSGHTYTVVGVASEYLVTGGAAYMRHNAVNTEHRAELQALVITDFNAKVDSVTVEATPTGANVEATVRVRISNGGNDWVQGRLVFTTSNTVQVGIESSVSGVVTSSSLVTVSGATTADPMSIRLETVGRTVRVRAWETSGTEPSTWDVTTTTTVLTPGYMALTSILETGNTNVAPYDVTFGNLLTTLGVIVFVGEVPEWPHRWDSTGNDVWVAIKAAGITRRLVQGNVSAGSALKRKMSTLDLIGYWSFEGLEGDGNTHDVMLSDLEGGNSLHRQDWDYNASVIAWGDNTTLVGSEGLLTMSLSADTSGLLDYDNAFFSEPVSTHNQFSLCFWLYSSITGDVTNVDGYTIVLFDNVNGTFALWSLTVDIRDIAGTKSLALSVFADDGAIINAFGTTTYTNEWHFVRVTVDIPSAGNVRVRGYINEVLVASDTGAGAAGPGQPSKCTRIGLSLDSDDQSISAGHYAWASGVGTDDIAANAATIFSAGRLAHAGETATDRMARLCAEEGITLNVSTAEGEAGTEMGAQPVSNFVALLEECALADGGILFELRSEFGYGYRSREYLYATTSTLELDYSNTDLSEVPEVTDDDQRIVNLFTAKRADGKGPGVTVRKSTGPLSTQDPYADPPGAGVYPDGETVNVFSDSQLADYAGWRVHLGTWDESRWPGVAVAMERTPFSGSLSKLASSVFLDIGEVMSIVNTPAWLGPDSVMLQIRGVEVFLSNFQWGIQWTTLPAAPWSAVSQLDNTDYGRLDTGSSELLSAVDTDDTEFVVQTTETDAPYDVALWTEDIGDLNFGGASGIDLRLNPPSRVGGLGGEQVRLSSTASRSDTFTRSGQLSGSNADTGQTWVNTTGTAADATTDGSKAALLHSVANTVLHQTLPGPSAHVCATVDIAFSVSSATGGDLLGMLVIRQTDGSNYYGVKLRLAAGGGATALLSIVEVVAGVETTLSSVNVTYSVANTANTFIRVKGMVYHRGLFAKAWLRDTADEPDWMINLPNAATDLVSGSDIALRSQRSTGNTDANATMYFDNLSVLTSKVRPYAWDFFGRTVASGLGSADEGGAWTTINVGGVAADIDVVPGSATTTFTAANIQLGGYLDDVDLTDVCVSQVFSLSALPTGANLLSSILLRGNAGPTAIVCRVQVSTSTFSHILNLDITAANGTSLGTKTFGLYYTSSAQLRVKAAAVGTSIMMKVWEATGNEPDYWQLSVVDTTTSPVSGWVGFFNERPTGNTNANVVISVYDFRVDNPQRMTVTRSVNAVTKSWPAGNDVRLWSPMILGR